MADPKRSVGRVAALGALCALAAGLSAPTAEAAFAGRKVITLNRARVPGTADLTNFPVLVRITGDTQLKTTAFPGGLVTSALGHDILFQGDATACSPAPAGCRLDHEIESYDGVAGNLVAWVRVPNLPRSAAAADAVLYLYYGDATVTCSQENKAGVWDASYREVFHLHESGDHVDSTKNAFTGTSRGAVTKGATGQIGRAVDLAGGATGATPASLNVSDGTLPTATSYTVEAWVNFRSYTLGKYIGIYVKGREAYYLDGAPVVMAPYCPGGEPCGDWVGLYNIPDDYATPTHNLFAMGWASGDGPNLCKVSNLEDARGAGVADVLTGQWYHVSATYDHATKTRRLYVDGAPVATDSIGACIDAPIPQYGRIGTDSNQTYLDGQVDEVRVSETVRSADWIAAGYSNQRNPAGFYTSIVDQSGPYAVTATACPAKNPCAGGPGTCYLRSIGDTTPYTAGSGGCTATNGSSVVSCPGAGWQSANRGRGDRITFGGTEHYMVLSVDSETSLRLSTPYTGTTESTKTYEIARQFGTLQAWENCISTGGGACPYFAVASGNLVTGNRSEIGVAYKGATYTGAGGVPILEINNATTDASHTITLTADGSNRHYGVSGAGVVLDNSTNGSRAIVIQDQYVTFEWMEIRNGSGAGSHCVDYVPSNGSNHAVIRNNIIRNCSGQGIRIAGSATAHVADINNNIVYRGAREGVRVQVPLGTGTGSQVRVFNNTFLRNNGATEISTAETPNPYVVLRNNIFVDDAQAPDTTWNDGALCAYAPNCDWWSVASGNNITGDAAPPDTDTLNWTPALGPNPRGGGRYGTAESSLNFINTTAGSENLHIQTGSVAWNAGSNLTGFVAGDIDAVGRTAPWDIGADELPAGAAPPLIVYSDTAASGMRPLLYTTLQGTAWSAPGQVAAPGPFPTTNDWPLFAKVARTSPNGTRRAAVFSENYESGLAQLHAQLFDGTNWDDGLGVPYSDVKSFGNTISPTPMTMRHFDAAYEQLSGKLLVVSGSNTDETVYMWTYNGTSWSANLWATPAGNGGIGNNNQDAGNTFRWVRLEPRPGTNRIAFIGSGTDTSFNDSAVISAAVWDGDTNTFGSKLILSFPVTGPDGVTPQNPHVTDGIDIDYVLGGVNAGEAVAVWGTQTSVWHDICSAAGTWGSKVRVQDLGAGNTVRWIRQKAASNSDNMILAVEDINERIYTIRYDGDTRTFASFTSTPHTTTAYGNADLNRPFDVVWDLGMGANNVLLVYSDTAGIKYRTSADGGNLWTLEQTLTAAYQAHWVQLERDPSNIVHLVVKDQNNDLRAWTWKSGTWTVTTPSLPSTNVETNGANQNVEGFALATWPPFAAGTTAVKLTSFSASPGDASVTLTWRTGAEIDNLGFHVYRGPSADGPWTRLTSTLIPGLGSSPLGQAYVWQDAGLVNGQRYYYRLEDVDTASVSTFHGPVSAVPEAPAPVGDGDPGGGGKKSDDDGKKKIQGDCPAWVLQAYAEATSADAVPTGCRAYGRPEAVTLRELSRDARSATLELATGGFYAVEEPEGTVRVFVHGFDTPAGPEDPALPLRRALVEAQVGRAVRLVSAQAFDLRRFADLRPSAVGEAELGVSRDGSIRARRRAVKLRRPWRNLLPSQVATLAGTVFQGEEKSAVVELVPIRFDPRREGLVLAGRVVVRLSFAGREPGEWGKGRRGRRPPRARAPLPDQLANLYTTRTGLHAVRFEDLFPGRRRGVPADSMRLQRQGEPVGFHLEPATASFGPGSVLYFYADTVPPSMAYSSEIAYELVQSTDGQRMALAPAAPVGAPLGSAPLGRASFETNRIHQPAILTAPDPWLWERVPRGTVVVKAFALAGIDTTSPWPVRLDVDLQGASDVVSVPFDHHVRISLNGYDVGESSFDGWQPHRVTVQVPATALREGTNEIAVSNVGDTGVTSLFLLDRFSLEYPQARAARGGVFEGVWPESGVAEVGGLGGPAAVLDVTDASSAGTRWLSGFEALAGLVHFRAEAGRRYVVASGAGILAPRVVLPPPPQLRDTTNRADYLLIAPEAFLQAAEPLLERRRGQGLVAKPVSLEAIAREFGFGSPSGEAIKAFLAYAYHSWAAPSPRYVVLLGDSSTDPRNFTGTSVPSPLPALWSRTSYLWTVSDPELVAVNGEDPIPDLAIGRLPATTVEQAQVIVSKLLAWEDTGQDLRGAAAIVADNPDAAGDFEANAHDIADTFLADRNPRLIFLRELGAATRPAILDAFDSGLSLVSYVGHGGAAVWAGENVLNSMDPQSLRAQSRQPVVLTLNCLNGYFVAPNYESLSEALLKVEGRGAIAAFSPSGLSLDTPAHVYHRAVMAELTRGAHARLGDALLAAQRSYAEAGVMPELLTIYHLVGDPATRIQ